MTTPRAVLAFDTSLAHCAVALWQVDRPMMTRREDMVRGQGERLMPLLEEVLSEAGLGWHDLDALAVGTGPGNFTGLRIAVSAARGVSLGLGIPAIGVSAFDAARNGQGRGTVALPAPRNRVYVDAPGEPVRICPVEMAPVDALPPAPPDALAARIARIAVGRFGTPQPRPAPVYARAADAAPPSDPPPVLLP